MLSKNLKVSLDSGGGLNFLTVVMFSGITLFVREITVRDHLLVLLSPLVIVFTRTGKNSRIYSDPGCEGGISWSYMMLQPLF